MGCHIKFEKIHKVDKALSRKTNNYNTFQQDLY